LPKKIGWNLFLNGLTSAKGLKLPRKIRTLCLNNLTSAEGLELPEEIEFNLELNGLTSALGLTLPKKIDSLYLDGLTSAKDLKLTNIKIEGYIYLDKIPYYEKQELRKKYPNLSIV